MTVKHPPLGEALAARGAHEVLRQELEHRRARQPDQHRHLFGGEHDHRQNPPLPAPQTEGRDTPDQRKLAEPARHVERKQHDQHQGQPEVRRGDPERRRRRREVVDERVAPDRRNDAKRDRHEDRQGDGVEVQQGRHGDGLEDHLPDRHAGTDQRSAEVAAQKVPGPNDVLLVQRAVQAPLGANGLDLRVGDGDLPFAQQQIHRIARHQPHDDEGHDADEHHDEEAFEDTERQITRHAGLFKPSCAFGRALGHSLGKGKKRKVESVAQSQDPT